MACPANQITTDLGCFPNDPVGFAEKFYGIGLGFVGALALMCLIYGGYVIMNSHGDPIRLNKGKSYIYYAIAGLLLAVFGWIFIQTVIVDILHVPGFS
jgi:hypothetical protein